MKSDLWLPHTGAWMDGTGGNGSIGGRHGLRLWKLVSDLKYGFLSLFSLLRKSLWLWVFDLCCKFLICWWKKSHFILLRWLIWCVFLHCRQDVAYQMRTKTKEECESHYMKNFINNPLFSSTLLSLRKTKDSHFAEGAIPFRRQYPRHLHSLLLFLCWHEKPFTFNPLL